VVARIRARLAREEGMTIIELLTAMAILGFVLSGILAMFVGGLRAETDMNKRFQAQQNARLALVSMRKDIRTACSQLVPAGGMSVTFTEPNVTTGCGSGTSQVTWCASSASGTAPFGLYRQTGATCSYSTGVQKAGSLQCAGTNPPTCPTPVFAYTPVSGTRPQLQVYLPVQANLSNNAGNYTLSDVVTLRNAPVS
jgi:Tfp pilus assembly protein PilW